MKTDVDYSQNFTFEDENGYIGGSSSTGEPNRLPNTGFQTDPFLPATVDRAARWLLSPGGSTKLPAEEVGS